MDYARISTNLEDAWREVAAEDLAAAPCMVCASPAEFTAVWTPTAASIEHALGGNPRNSRTVLYRLCGRCEAKAKRKRSFVRRIETAIIESVKAGRAHRFKDGHYFPGAARSERP
jgi:hypothetical protein